MKRAFHLLSALSLLFLLSLFAAPFAARASFSFNGVGDDSESLSVQISPAHPKKGDFVSAKLQSFLINLEQSSVTWTLNGAKIGSGQNLTRQDLGTIDSNPLNLDISIKMDTGDGRIRVLDKKVSIQPADVTLLWQATSSVPPLYPGKALFPSGGTGTVFAISKAVNPKGIPISPEKLSYSWKVNSVPDAENSGLGKQSYPISDRSFGKPMMVEVEVLSSDGSWDGTSSIVIAPTTPLVLVYEKNPIEGAERGRELSRSGYKMTSAEATLHADPFFFSYSPNSLAFQWYMNGNQLSEQTEGDAVMRSNTSNGGISLMSVQVSSSGSISEQGTASIPIGLPGTGIGAAAVAGSGRAAANPFN